jgi:RNA recognition motif-containing protein
LKKIYVGNLSYKTTEDDLSKAFSAFGTVRSATINRDRETGQSRGFGFVEMGSDEQATAAIEGLNGSELGGRRLTVNEARPRPAGGGRGDRGPRGDRGDRAQRSQGW